MADFTAKLTPETATASLCGAGIGCAVEDVQVIARDERWAVLIGGDRIAWFPASELGGTRLSIERRVLSLIAERCSFQAPRLLFVSPRGFDVRQMVPGQCDPWGLFHRCKADSRLTQKIGRAIGAILAEQHTRIVEADVAGWLPQRTGWPLASDWVRERLPLVLDDDGFIHAMEEVIERYEAVPIRADDRVLIHGDVGLHNLALDAESDTVNGIFDYDSAAWTDRHHDFRYLLFDVGREDMLEAALGVYEPATGRPIDRNRVRLYNAACAISFLAFRVGTPAEEKSCGRTLAEDVRWVRTALAKLTS
jgi:Phosphotransferase enzyme family